MPDLSNRFFLQAIDPDHGSPVIESMFMVDDLDALRVLLGSCADDDQELGALYYLDAGELAAITVKFAVRFDPEGREVCLRRWHSIRAVPYLVHTDYELPLLLEGRKQFAHMADAYPPHHHHNEGLFDRYVTEGMLHKEVSLAPFTSPARQTDGTLFEGIRWVYYTRNGEEWRIKAWKLVSAASRKAGWNDSFVRIEGMLFGYEEWQMDWWIAHRQEQAAITARELAEQTAATDVAQPTP